MSKERLWDYYDENDQHLFSAYHSHSHRIGTKVKADGNEYVVWYIEERKDGCAARMERKYDPQP